MIFWDLRYSSSREAREIAQDFNRVHFNFPFSGDTSRPCKCNTQSCLHTQHLDYLRDKYGSDSLSNFKQDFLEGLLSRTGDSGYSVESTLSHHPSIYHVLQEVDGTEVPELHRAHEVGSEHFVEGSSVKLPPLGWTSNLETARNYSIPGLTILHLPKSTKSLQVSPVDFIREQPYDFASENEYLSAPGTFHVVRVKHDPELNVHHVYLT